MSVDTGPKTGPERPSVHMGPFSVDPFFAGTVWIPLTFRTGSGTAPCKLLLDKLQTVSSTEAIPVRFETVPVRFRVNVSFTFCVIGNG